MYRRVYQAGAVYIFVHYFHSSVITTMCQGVYSLPNTVCWPCSASPCLVPTGPWGRWWPSCGDYARRFLWWHKRILWGSSIVLVMMCSTLLYRTLQSLSQVDLHLILLFIIDNNLGSNCLAYKVRHISGYFVRLEFAKILKKIYRKLVKT